MNLAGTLCGALLLAGCGQKGPLYMPDQATQVITRPTQTPPDQKPADEKPPGQSQESQPPADAPPAEAPPAEVTAPDKKKEPGAPAQR